MLEVHGSFQVDTADFLTEGGVSDGNHSALIGPGQDAGG